MASLADLLNSITEFTHDGITYKLRQPTLLECGQYQRWLESEARASAAAATELPEEDRRNLLRDVNADIAAKLYAWGGEVCVKSLRTPDGIAKLMSIVCGILVPDARAVVDKRLHEIAAILMASVMGDDPEKKAELRQLLLNLGLPPNFLNTPSSNSPTNSDPPDSPPSGE